MVSEKTIKYIIDDAVNKLSVKCPTISEMRSQLSGMSYRDMMHELHDKDLFSSIFEWRYFSDLLEDYEMYNLSEDSRERHKDELEEIEEEFFQMGRKLIEGLPPQNPIPDIDKSSYNSDEQLDGFWDENSSLSTRVGKLEQKQIDSQTDVFSKDSDRIVDDATWGVHGEFDDSDERFSMNEFFSGDASHLNRDIYNKKYLKELDDAQQSRMKNIDKLMNKSKGLSENTVLYRAGKFDVHLREGDHAKWKGYTSTSFQRATAEEYGGGRFDVMYVVHAPKGTKGVAGNDRRNFKNGFLEHEYTLPRNTGYTVLSVDPDNRIVEIVLD